MAVPAMVELTGLFGRWEECLARRPFHPHRLLANGHLQTIAGAYVRRRFDWGWTEARERQLELSDGACIRYFEVGPNQGAPTLILVHGMGGSSDSGYMRGLSHKAFREGWNAILLNLYNRNQELAKPRIFHAGCSSQLREITTRLIDRHRLDRVFLAGVSMGGNIILKMLAEDGELAVRLFQRAGVISPLVDLEAGCRELERPRNRLYQVYYTGQLIRAARSRADGLVRRLDPDRLDQIRTVREFDEVVTAPLSGFDGASDYYRRCSSVSLLGGIRVPTVVLHARDDPVLPWGPLDSEAVRTNPFLKVHLSRHGGHVAFLAHDRGEDVDRSWAESRVIDFFRVLTTEDTKDTKS